MSIDAHTLRETLERVADRSQRALERLSGVTDKLRPVVPRLSSAPPPPQHVQSRLEGIFEALADLALQPNVAAALELAADALEAELPSASMALALHDIDSDEMRFVVARGVGGDLLQGTALPVSECLVGHAAYDVVTTDGGPEGAHWIAPDGADSCAMLCPILHEHTLLGILVLADPLCAAEFGDHDVELVRYVAAQLAAFIHAQRHRPPPEQPAAD